MDERLVLRVRNDMLGLEDGRLRMRRFLERQGIGLREVHRAELVFEEIVTNSIRYGYDDQAEHAIELTISLSGECVVLTFEDDGRPFNPLERREPVLPKSLEDAKVGGLGLLLVRRTAAEISYERTDGRNRTRIAIGRQ